MRVMVRSAVASLLLWCGACHIIDRVPDLRPGETQVLPHPDRAHTLPPTLVVTTDGRFRFVEPRRCPTTQVVDMQASTIVKVRPNLATFVVGAILGSLGAVGTAVAIGEHDPAGQPLTYAAPVALGVGLVFAIGPFVGTGQDRTYEGVKQIERPGADVPCGEHAVHATGAIVTWHGLRAVGAVDDDGYFSVSPYEITDAFAAGRGPALDLGADLALASGAHEALQVVIAGDAMLKGRDAFLTRAGIDGRREALRKVPRVEHGTLRVSKTSDRGRPVLRVALPLSNEGPGDAWQVRGIITTQDPEVDGRVLYVGHIAPHGATIATVDVPLSPEADRALSGASIELGVTLIDADATTSGEPVRFRGAILNDVPR
jgi:hypothetical protein